MSFVRWPCFMAAALFAVALLAASAQANSGGGEKKGEEAEADSAPSGPSDRYVHKWIAFPKFAGALLPGADAQRGVEARSGRVIVVVFLASWCEPCQQLLPEFRAMEKRYQRLAADFHYVFVHDTLEDSSGFMKEFGIDQAILGNAEILKTFHNPDLPTIYVGDRHGWLMTRYVKAGPEAVRGLDELLKYLTAY